MKIGLVLSSTPAYSETFFLSKIKSLKKYSEVILFVQNSDFNFTLCQVRTSYNSPRTNLFRFLFNLLQFIRDFILKPRRFTRHLILDYKDRSSLIQALKNTYNNAHILKENLDCLHFGFATMAIGKENVAKSIGSKMSTSIRGYDITIYPLKFPNCYDLLWDKIDRLHTISDDLLLKAYKHGLKKTTAIQKITPAIDINKFNSSSKHSNLKFLNITTIGRLHWKKGYDEMLMALHNIKHLIPNFRYNIIGEGSNSEKIKYLIHKLKLEENVILHGKLNHDKIITILSKSDLYLQYSLQEGFCNAVLEAQAMGVLSIVSDAEGLPENIINTRTGWVVPKFNPDKLSEKILEFTTSSSEIKHRMEIAAIERVKSSFNLKKQSDEFYEFFQKLLKD